MRPLRSDGDNYSRHHRTLVDSLEAAAGGWRTIEAAFKVTVHKPAAIPFSLTGPRHARVSCIWSPARRSNACICCHSPRHRD